MTGSRIGTTMSISGKKCAKYEARFAQIEAIPWSTKLATPKNTAKNRKRLSKRVASFFTGVSSGVLQAKPILELSPWQDPSWPFC